MNLVITLARTIAFPTMINPNLALVRETFIRRGSVKKPIPYPSLDLTVEITI